MDRNAPKSLIIVAIIVGIIFFVFPTVYKIINNYNHREYINTTATFVQVSNGITNEDGIDMYYLVYKYNVKGEEYYYTTDYTTSNIPKDESTIIIKYNPSNPKNVYYNSFDVFGVFQIIGIFILSVTLTILFFDLIWLRDAILFLSTGSLILIFINNKFYSGAFIIALIILGIFCFASIIDFISYLKSGEFKPLKDVKKEIDISEQIKEMKKQEKSNLSLEDKKQSKVKKKNIIKGLLMFIVPLPLVISVDILFGYPNQVIYYIFVITAVICTFFGFFIVGFTLTGVNSSDTTVVIAGKVIDNNDINNINKMTFWEKIKTFNIIRLILAFISIPLFLGIVFLIMEDPLNFFSIFENVGRAQMFSIVGFVIIINILYMIFSKNYVSKFTIIIFVIGCILALLYVYYITIPENKNNSLYSNEIKNIAISNYL